MSTVAEQEFIAQIKDRIALAKWQDGVISFTFCRGKFKVSGTGNYEYNMFLRITDCGDDILNICLDYPKSSISIRSSLPFFHKLKARIIELCGDQGIEEEEVTPRGIRTSSPNPFDS